MSAPAEEHTAVAGGLTGPTATLRATVGVLAALAVVLAVTAGRATALLPALGVIGLVPLAVGALSLRLGWRGRRPADRLEQAEDAAVLTPAAALCWPPVVVLTDLNEQIFRRGPVATAAGVAAVLLGLYCARRP